MNSTVGLTCTRFVPETITGGVPAGQSVGDWYKSRFDMKCTMGNADQGEGGADSLDLQELGSRWVGKGRDGARWFVPVLYPTPLAVVFHRQDRRTR